ncbi:hypothetical protein [Dyadobacter aurulentus]|uniref:hypothetical protein n=1 Tax=Dyadobacter sp. UC 10 TaxID=2605428 RepID=UPI0011F2A08D|nr:hypothetical protein [Dyadobacter sp. UC 10]KAA0991289.1 hypothetical protein FXO21_14515 [Dyadobacter sp. UC 10]
MTKLLFALTIPLFLLACKKDSPKPDPTIQTIVGTWKHTAYEKNVNGVKTWAPIDVEPHYMTFRSDGLIVDSNGLPQCCAPKAYYVNGVLFEVQPKETVPVNDQCGLVDCISCDTWNIEQTENELIVTICQPHNLKSKYIRE